MRQPRPDHLPLRRPVLLDKAQKLASYIQTLTPDELAKIMHISTNLAAKTQDVYQRWTTAQVRQTLALDSFVGDIYSGLRADSLSVSDRDHADQVLRILSGLYGVLRPYDGIFPYRLEMGYKLPGFEQPDLYAFWKDAIAATLPSSGPIVNASSVEFTRTITPFVDKERLITPQFLTRDTKTGEPTFVVVHAKIARGAYARWLIQHRATKPADMTGFDDIGYRYDPERSTPSEPVFVCEQFEGKGLSMR